MMRVTRFMVLRNRNRRRGQRGMTLVEVLVAGAVLTVGLLSLMGLAMIAVQSNSRNRLDGLSTMLAQQILERIHYEITTQSAIPNSAIEITDCNNQTYTIESGVDTGTAGANVASNGNIDYSQSAAAVPSGYIMNGYAVCPNPTKSSVITFDVRWNIQQVPNAVNLYLVTVGAKPTSWSSNARMFAFPANVRAVLTAGQQ